MTAAEWRDLWTVASAVVARQSPPMQILFWLGVAFVALMFVEGLRASFLPGRYRQDGSRREVLRQREPSSSSVAGTNGETRFVRAQRLNAMRYRKLDDAPPRRHQAFRPKIRRSTGDGVACIAGSLSDLSDQTIRASDR